MKTVTVAIIDELTKLPTGKTEDVVLSDAIEVLVAQGVLLNDSEGVFFQRQLEYIQAQSFDVLYPDLMGRECFAANTEGGEGITQITYRSYDKRGETAIIAGKATDLPRGDIDGKEYTIDIRTLGNAFGYSRQELAASRLTGMPLEQRKAEATRRSYEEKVNQLIWFGDADSKINGIFGGPVGYPWNDQKINPVADSGIGGDLTWGGNKTPDEVIADLTNAASVLYADTKKIFRPNMILLSVEKKQYLMNTPRSIHSDTSIMDWFLRNNQFFTSADQFKDINELEGIYPASADMNDFAADGSEGEGFTILASAAENLRVREPFPYVHLPVQYKGLEFEINCYGRFAGIEMVRPDAIQHWVGI